MDQCPKCKHWLLVFDHRSETVICYNKDCNYRKEYCRERWIIVHNVLPGLLGKSREYICHKYNFNKEKCKHCDLKILEKLL